MGKTPTLGIWFMVNSYLYQLVPSHLVLFSLVNLYFFATRTLVNSYFFFDQLVLFSLVNLYFFFQKKNTYDMTFFLFLAELQVCLTYMNIPPNLSPDLF